MIRSLQGRLGVGLILSLVTLFVLQWLVVRISLHSLTENYLESRLSDDIESLVAKVRFDKDGAPVLSAEHVNPTFNPPFSGHYFYIASGPHILRSRSLWDTDLALVTPAVGQSAVMRLAGPQKQQLIMRVSSYKKSGRLVTIAAAEDYSSMEKDFQIFLWRYALISLVALIVLIIIQVLVVRGSLRPLEQVRQDMRKLEHGEIQRLTGNVPQEVKPLVQEINRMLQIMGQRLERSRHALGNLAHALKTPLTVLMQTLQGKELDDKPALREQLAQQAQTIEHYIQRELKRARLAGAASPGYKFLLSEEIPQLVETLRQMYRDKHLAIEYTFPPDMSFVGDREDMLELLGNLLDNACKWAHSRVAFTVRDDPGFSFAVEDDGPGVPADKLEQLTQRGVRVDETVAGHGLGLAIVREIVDQYGGEIRMGRSETVGGFRVDVRLPQASSL